MEPLLSGNLTSPALASNMRSDDLRAFTTDHDKALEELYSESAEKYRQFDITMTTMAIHIATVFASLKLNATWFFFVILLRKNCLFEYMLRL
uniref:Uncharacterized protein n=1 Tax=Lactuca sativa TaxID=4236 RepID=A0A9R1UED1_LACSA|nr:hypothetical protein LSAT_V11C900461950 [Lactuca sativa]